MNGHRKGNCFCIWYCSTSFNHIDNRKKNKIRNEHYLKGDLFIFLIQTYPNIVTVFIFFLPAPQVLTDISWVCISPPKKTDVLFQNSTLIHSTHGGTDVTYFTLDYWFVLLTSSLYVFLLLFFFIVQFVTV